MKAKNFLRFIMLFLAPGFSSMAKYRHMKKALSIWMFCCCILSANAQTYPPLNTYGGATAHFGGFDVYVMSDMNTTCAGPQPYASAIWSPNKLNFYKSFTIEWQAYTVYAPLLGYTVPSSGMCLVFGNYIVNTGTSGSINGKGSYLGYYNEPFSHNPEFDNSIAIEMDVYDDGTSISSTEPSSYVDHLMYSENGDINDDMGYGTVQIDPTSPSIATPGNWGLLNYMVSWDCYAQTLSVTVSNNHSPYSLRMSHYVNRSVFDDPFNVTWGFTCGTGPTGCSQQVIMDPQANYGNTPCLDGNPGSPCATITLSGIYDHPSGLNCSFIGTTTVNATPGFLINSISYATTNPAGGTTIYPGPLATSVTIPGTVPGFSFVSAPGLYKISIIADMIDMSTMEHCYTKVTKRVNCNGGLTGSVFKQSRTDDHDINNQGIAVINADNITLAPNPATDLVKIAAPEEMMGAEYKIYDINGSVVNKGTINTQQQSIPLDGFASGIYTLRITKSGVTAQNLRFIKE